MKCCMHYHSMGIIKIYFGKSQENLKNFSSRASKLQQEGLPPTDIFLRMALVTDTSHWSHWTGVINIKQTLGSCTTGRNTALDRCPLYTGFVIT